MNGPRLFFLVSLLLAAALIVIAGAGALAGTTSDIPADVVAGYHVWQTYNCESCHAVYGQGGSFGPDLTGIYAQRGDAYLVEFMVNPAAFHPDERVMPRFGLTVNATDAEGNVINPGETEQVIAFLEWVGQPQHAANWPPRTIAVTGSGAVDLALADPAAQTVDTDEPQAAAIQRGRRLFAGAPGNCASCHSLEPDVVIVGPSLYGIADRAWYRVPGQPPEEYIRESVINPGVYVVEGYSDVMAKNLAEQLSSDQLNDLIAYLMTLEEEDEA